MSSTNGHSPMRAVLYACVSSDDQVRGYSLNQQIEVLRAYCVREGYEVRDEGWSGAYLVVRWALVMFHFDQALYADPARVDLNTVWWDLVERFQLVERPPGRDEPDWAAKLHVALAPVYYHNYVLGNLIAAQLRNYLESYITCEPFYKNEAAGRYMLEAVFGPGAREGWQDTVLRATGEPLSAEYFVKSLA